MHHPGITTHHQRPAWAAGLLAITAALALTAVLALAASALGATTGPSVRVGASHSAPARAWVAQHAGPSDDHAGH